MHHRFAAHACCVLTFANRAGGNRCNKAGRLPSSTVIGRRCIIYLQETFPPRGRIGPMRSLSNPHIHWYVLSTVLLCVFLVSLWGLRPGHSLGDDFAMYILQAKNFADGQPHRPTGYLFNPAVPHVGPQEYPPVVPLILAAVYKFKGLDLQAMKVALLAVFLVSLIPLYWLVDEYLRNPIWSGVAVLAFALNPVILELHNLIGSDLALLPFVFAFLYVVDVVYPRNEVPSRRLALAVLCGVLAYAAYATRTVGAVLILVPPAWDLLRYRRLGLLTYGALVTVGACFVLQTTILAPSSHEASILSLFILSPSHAFSNAFSYLRDSRSVIPIRWKPGSMLLYFLALALALVGAKHWARRGPTAVVLFAAGYAVVILFYEVLSMRYIVPLLPLFILLVATGAIWLSARVPAARAFLSIGFAVYALACVNAAVRTDRSPIREGMGDENLVKASRYIAENAPPDAHFSQTSAACSHDRAHGLRGAQRECRCLPALRQRTVCLDCGQYTG